MGGIFLPPAGCAGCMLQHDSFPYVSLNIIKSSRTETAAFSFYVRNDRHSLNPGKLLKCTAIDQKRKMFFHVSFVGNGILITGAVFGQNIADFVKLFGCMV